LKRALILALGTCLASAPMALIAAGPAAAQAKAAAYKAPRNAFGQPDLSGNWTNATLTRETRPANVKDRLAYTEEEAKALEGRAAQLVEAGNRPTDPNAPAPAAGGEAPRTETPQSAAGGAVGGYNRGWLDPGASVMRVGGQPRTSFLLTPDGQAPARKPGAPPERGFGGLTQTSGSGAGEARMGSFDSYETRGLGERCIVSFGRNGGPPMLPNGFYNNNYTFVQSPDHVGILVEMVHDMRIVRLNAKHRTDGVRPWFGDSVGWYEGDTLVVETTNIPRRQAYRGAWENLKVTERFTRVAPDRIHSRYTIEDPTIWEQPFSGEYEFGQFPEPIYEYACHEGNYSLPGILRGARVEEAAAKEQGGGGGTSAGSAP
jgi:hypothetical protein